MYFPCKGIQVHDSLSKTERALMKTEKLKGKVIALALRFDTTSLKGVDLTTTKINLSERRVFDFCSVLINTLRIDFRVSGEFGPVAVNIYLRTP